MKKIFIFTALLLGCGAAFAQNSPFKIKLSQPDKMILFRMDQVSASITGYDGDEIIIEAVADPNKQIPEEAKGLKLIPIPGRNVNSYPVTPRIKDDSASLSITIPQGSYRYLSIKVPQTAMLRVEMFNYLVDGRLIVKNVNLIRVWGIVPFIKISEVSAFDLTTGGGWGEPKLDNIGWDQYSVVGVVDGKIVKNTKPGMAGAVTTITGGKLTKLRVDGKEYTEKKDIDSLLKIVTVDAVNVTKTEDTVKKVKVNAKSYTGSELPSAIANVSAFTINKMPGGGSIIISDVKWSNKPMFINGHAYPRYYDISANHADIDLSIPGDLKANIIFSSAKGQVYSDLNVDPVAPSDDDIRSFKKLFHTEPGLKTLKLNGGGISIRLSNNTGNIYLRKQK
jgi:hypothetical protein